MISARLRRALIILLIPPVVTASVAGVAIAQDAPSVVALSVARTPAAEGAGCADEATLRADVVRELGRDPFRDDAALSVEIELDAVRGEDPAPRSSAVLTVRSSDGAELGHRVLESDARDCGELSAALVLSLVLLASDETGGLGGLLASPEPAEEPPAPDEGPAEALATPERDPPATRPSANAPIATDESEPEGSRATNDEPSFDAGAPPSLDAGALIRLDAELFPAPVAALGLTGVLRARGVPAIVLELTVGFPAQADVPGLVGPTADLQAFAGSLAVCPLETARGASAALAACVGLRAGALTSEGRGFDTAHDETGLLLSLPVTLRGDLAVAGPVILSAFGEIAPALVRTSFVAQHDAAEVRVHRVPPVGLAAGLAASVRFAFEDSPAAPTTP